MHASNELLHIMPSRQVQVLLHQITRSPFLLQCLLGLLLRLRLLRLLRKQLGVALPCAHAAREACQKRLMKVGSEDEKMKVGSEDEKARAHGSIVQQPGCRA